LGKRNGPKVDAKNWKESLRVDTLKIWPNAKSRNTIDRLSYATKRGPQMHQSIERGPLMH